MQRMDMERNSLSPRKTSRRVSYLQYHLEEPEERTFWTLPICHHHANSTYSHHNLSSSLVVTLQATHLMHNIVVKVDP